MKVFSPQSFAPIAITAITSILFLERYDPAYTVSMLTGLTLFFYFAECVRKTAIALRTRQIHHYAIPRTALLLHAPSFLAIFIAWSTRLPRTATTFAAGCAALAASSIFLWVLLWGISRFISIKTANNRLFLPIINYGLNILALLTPIFYPISAVRSEFIRTLLSYNPLATLIIGTRAAFIGNYAPVNITAIACTITLVIIIGYAGFSKNPNRDGE